MKREQMIDLYVTIVNKDVIFKDKHKIWKMLYKRRYPIGHEIYKKELASSIIKEMQIKNSEIPPTKKVKIIKNDNNNC